MSPSDQAPAKGAAMSPQQRAERIRQVLIARKAPPLEEGDVIRKLSSNSTLAVILMTDDLFRAAALNAAPSWEQYAVICGVIACLSDSITQFTGLPREGVPYMVADAIHFLFSGPDREKWPKMENTYGFAVTQYKHMMADPKINPLIDILGGSYYNWLGSDDPSYLEPLKKTFKELLTNPSVPDAIKDKGKQLPK